MNNYIEKKKKRGGGYHFMYSENAPNSIYVGSIKSRKI